MLSKRKHLRRQEILFLDLICVFAAYFLAAYIRKGILRPDLLSTMYGNTLIVILLSYFIYYLFKRENNDLIFKRGFIVEIREILQMQVVVVLFLLLYLFAAQLGVDYSRFFFIVYFVLSTLFMYVARSYYKLIMLSIYQNSRYNRKMHLITTSELVTDCIHSFRSVGIWDMKLESITILDQNLTGTSIYGIPVIANENNVIDVIQRDAVDQIMIHIPGNDESIYDLSKMILNFEKMGLTVHVTLKIPNGINIENKRIGTVAGYPTISYTSNIFDSYQMFFKRLIDLVGSIVGLLFTFILTCILAPIIYIENPGPIFFSQVRIGKNGRRFKIYKFRSMVTNAEELKKDLLSQNEMSGLMFKMENDPRVTKIGHFMRKTSLDEFPQFFNVLRGDMSLVGTRPPTEEEFEQYETGDRRRVSIRPGITGLWQVSGRSDISDFNEVVKLDLEYIDNWSIGKDIQILLKTIWIVIFGKGAK